jgi:DNA polymerase III subunit delta
MKYYISQLPIILTKIAKGEIKALLLYGPDRGYINEICDSIKNKFDMIVTNVTYDEFIKSDLALILSSANFFRQKELIKITDVGNSVAPNVKEIADKNFEHFPIFIGDDLRSDGSIRKFFESNNNNMASIACYYDDEQSIARLIRSKLFEYKKRIDDDALIYLKTHLKGDHNLINNELEKLACFTHDKDMISISDVKLTLSASLLAGSDELCIYFAQRNLSSFLTELEKLLELGTSEILIIRALIRYYVNLYIVLSKMNHNIKLEDAIKALTPPIFFKYMADFRRIASGANLQSILKTLRILQKAEKDFKTGAGRFDFYYNIYAKCHV